MFNEFLSIVLQAFDSPEAPRSKATPEDLVRVTKPITLATAKAVAAGNSCRQDDVIVAANVGRKAISDMLTVCKVRSLRSRHFNIEISWIVVIRRWLTENGTFKCCC